MRASKRIAELQAEITDLRGIVATLKAELYLAASTGIAPLPRWACNLRGQEHTLVGLLLGAYPRFVNTYDLLDGLPSYDHVKERDPQLVNVVVHRVRAKLGKSTIINKWGVGYALSAEGYSKLAEFETTPPPSPPVD